MSSQKQRLCWVKPNQEKTTAKSLQVPPDRTSVSVIGVGIGNSKYAKKAKKKNSLSPKDYPVVEGSSDDMNSKGFDDMDMAGVTKADNKKPSLKQFANETSAHGVKNVMSGHRYRRVSWFLAVVAAMIFLTYNLVTVFIDFQNYPFQTVFTLTPKSEIIFPVVTICPLNQLDSTKVEHMEELETILRIYAEGPFTVNSSIDEIKDIYPYNKILNWRYWDLMQNATPTIEETFVLCQWQKHDLDCAKHMTYINTPTGRCYQFNIDGNESGEPLKALRPGSRGGFSAVLRLNQEGYTVSERHAAGFKILLHDQSDYPDVFSRGQFFGPGFSYDVSFRKEQFHFLSEPYKAYENSYCSDKFPLNYSGSTEGYSMKSCIHHQDSLLTAQTCGCAEAECTVRQYLECYKPLFQEYYDNVTTIENVFECGFACSFCGFLVGISSVYFPSNKALNDFIADQVGASKDTFRESFLELNLYFEDLLVRESLHVPVYGNWFNIMAMLGGNMGLFLGASLLTIGELIEMFFLMCALIFLRLGFRKKQEAHDQENGKTDIKNVYVK